MTTTTAVIVAIAGLVTATVAVVRTVAARRSAARAWRLVERYEHFVDLIDTNH